MKLKMNAVIQKSKNLQKYKDKSCKNIFFSVRSINNIKKMFLEKS